ncbi:hypothetical protein KFK09_000274 [Dendrobium nobile]|uniref:Retrovirus-related Pol polyprotein from transposon TNT 1-94 n=1 Tax=Dendrobium nobile TaxID=94219 RepID=A0A8T3CAM2_DENNO|nr:hypothetical protein KFK09_000274 [Dendrobium nobile]
MDRSKEFATPSETSALAAFKKPSGNQNFQAEQPRANRGKPSGNRGFSGRNFNYTSRPTRNFNNRDNAAPHVTCQICNKVGHSTAQCWHRANLQYNPEQPTQRSFFTTQQSPPPSDWYLDSGATTHLTSDPLQLQYSQPYNGTDSISIANGSSLPIQSTGQGLLSLPNTFRKLSLQKLLHVPSLTHNLLSIHKLTTDNNCSICFDSSGFIIKDNQTNQIISIGRSWDGLYTIPTRSHIAFRTSQSASFLWHSRLGHPHLQLLQQLSRTIPTKWTFRTKLHPDGTLDRYKARLVAQGFKQQCGIDYKETNSPVAKMPTIRIMLAIALHRNWSVLQLDVANAFLHGILHEEVYMKQPQGFIDEAHPNYVCKLHKTIYGLKQAPRERFNTFTGYLQSLGFIFSKSDPSLLLYNTHDIEIYILLYVDDILITGNNTSKISELISKLQMKFSLKELGLISFSLGIQVSHTANGYFLSQEQYAQDVLQAAGLLQSKPAQTLMDVKPVSDHSTFLNLDPVQYRKLAGSLQYLTITRPDIAFATNVVCQHMHQPTGKDFNNLKRLLRYVQGTQQYGLPITKGTLQLHSFSDSDWAADSLDRKSISGFCTYLGNSLISWHVKKQNTVAKSSTEAEYRSLASATSDIIWLRRVLNDFRGSPTPTILSCDNSSALALANNPVFHARTKHIEIDFHFIRDRILSKEIEVRHLNTLEQPADILTKPLALPRFKTLKDKLTIQLHES